MTEQKTCLRRDTWYPDHYWSNWCKPFRVKGTLFAQYKQCLACGIAEKKVLDLRNHKKGEGK